jgi:hypothetical protein
MQIAEEIPLPGKVQCALPYAFHSAAHRPKTKSRQLKNKKKRTPPTPRGAQKVNRLFLP